MTGPADPHFELDQLGQRCPAPVIALGNWAKSAASGATVDLLADDPAAAYDVPAWCRMRGATLVSAAALTPPATGTRYRVRIGANATTSGSAAR